MNQKDIDAFWAEVIALIPPAKPVTIEYRLHYNEDGNITMCSMADHPESLQYVVVDKETYDNYFLYTIVNGMPKRRITDSGHHVQLQKSTAGFAVVKNHAGLLIENEPYSNIEYYEYRNY